MKIPKINPDNIVLPVAIALATSGVIFAITLAYLQYAMNDDIGYAIIVVVCASATVIIFKQLFKRVRIINQYQEHLISGTKDE